MSQAVHTTTYKSLKERCMLFAGNHLPTSPLMQQIHASARSVLEELNRTTI